MKAEFRNLFVEPSSQPSRTSFWKINQFHGILAKKSVLLEIILEKICAKCWCLYFFTPRFCWKVVDGNGEKLIHPVCCIHVVRQNEKLYPPSVYTRMKTVWYGIRLQVHFIIVCCSNKEGGINKVKYWLFIIFRLPSPPPFIMTDTLESSCVANEQVADYLPLEKNYEWEKKNMLQLWIFSFLLFFFSILQGW